MPTRRLFVKQSVLTMFGMGVAPAWLARAATATNARKKVLVAVFQRGAMDGLNAVVPYGDPNYYALRSGISIPQKDVLVLNDMFGLHPSLAPLKTIYDAGHLAVIEAVGSPDTTRSHFDAQDYMESGTPGRKATRDGWMNRAMPTTAGAKSPVRAVSIGTNLARSIRGANPAIAVSNLGDFQIRDTGSAESFEGMYASTLDKVMGGTGRDTFDALRTLQSIQKQHYRPASGADYPAGRFGQSMQQIARLIKADVGLELAFADMAGWDTHVNEVSVERTGGQLANLLRNFGQSLGAFYQDLGDRIEDVVVVTMSEFGRTARENGNRGTDHGHANVMFAFGGGIAGGKVLGDWPGLAPEQLYEGRDLKLTTDFRDVLGEVVTRHLGTTKLGAVFPGYESAKFRGVVKSS